MCSVKSRTTFKMPVMTDCAFGPSVLCITSETSSELSAQSSSCVNRFAIPPRDEGLPWLQGKDPCPISPNQILGLTEKPSFYLESHGGILWELAIVLLLDLNPQARV